MTSPQKKAPQPPTCPWYGTVAAGVLAAWTALIGPRWLSAVLVVGFTIELLVTERLVYWLKQHVAALQDVIEEARRG